MEDNAEVRVVNEDGEDDIDLLLPMDEGWERNCPVFDEVEEVVRLSKEDLSTQKYFIEELFLVACNLTFDSVSSRQTRQHKHVLHGMLATEFESVVLNWPLKEFAQIKLFHHLERNTWPNDLAEYITKVKADVKTKAANTGGRNQQVPQNMQDAAAFGAHIMKVAANSRSVVISNFNPLYVSEDELPNGHTMSDMYHRLRYCVYQADCKRRAVSATQK